MWWTTPVHTPSLADNQPWAIDFFLGHALIEAFLLGVELLSLFLLLKAAKKSSKAAADDDLGIFSYRDNVDISENAQLKGGTDA